LLFETFYFVLAMFLKLQVLNNFKFEYFLGGQIPIFMFIETISLDITKSSDMGEQKSQLQNPSFTIIPPQNYIAIPKMFELSKNPKPIVVDEDVHVSNPKK